MGVRYAQDQILIRLNDSVENHDEFIWAVAGSREIRGDVIGRGDGRVVHHKDRLPGERQPRDRLRNSLLPADRVPRVRQERCPQVPALRGSETKPRWRR